ncbi:MAG: hypothetical protein NVS4B2_29240 [Chloroflexota bacterium]
MLVGEHVEWCVLVKDRSAVYDQTNSNPGPFGAGARCLVSPCRLGEFGQLIGLRRVNESQELARVE